MLPVPDYARRAKGTTLPPSKPESRDDDELPSLAPPASEVTPAENRHRMPDFSMKDDDDEDTAVSERALPIAVEVDDPEWDDGEDEEETGQHLKTTQRVGKANIPGQTPTRAAPVTSWNVRLTPVKSDPLCGRTIASGKYRLESVIGQGAVGIVFKALHTSLGRSVAIKVLHPSYRSQPESLAVFEREARAASLLEHPHVARLYDYGEEPDGLVYIVMEYLSGYTLGSVLGARRKVAVPRAVDLMLQACAALAAAHERGIVHRDVKPDNLVLVPEHDDEGQPIEIVKVCDFGIAALAPATAKLPADTRAYIAGTPEYMSPEQALGEPTTPATDVYGCGVVLYEMLAGRLPFVAEQAYQIAIAHIRETPPPIADADVPRRLEDIVLRAMEKKPERRFANARELRLALRKVR
jgi:serine/threonine protein kinase